ncbi:hypothetical protein BGZ46_004210 [Entomortierella lignicola]|nr:hypothetical protein BGZ46_004210 [Entomortierella lignicola]
MHSDETSNSSSQEIPFIHSLYAARSGPSVVEILYYPAIGAPSHWFNARRGLALGIAVSGTGVGGLILAPSTQALVDNIGISWTLRILAIIYVVICGGASLMIEIPVPKPASTSINEEYNEELPPNPKSIFASFFSELKIFKDAEFFSLTFAQIAACIAYATFIGLTPQNGALIAGISSGSSSIERIVLGLAADHFPKTIIISSCAWITAGSVLIILALAKSFGVYLLFGLVYGFFSGTYFTIIPLVLSETFGADQITTLIGLMYASSGFGILAGAPVAGVLLDASKPNITYAPIIFTAGGALLLAAICVSCWVIFKRQNKKKMKDSGYAMKNFGNEGQYQEITIGIQKKLFNHTSSQTEINRYYI